MHMENAWSVESELTPSDFWAGEC